MKSSRPRGRFTGVAVLAVLVVGGSGYSQVRQPTFDPATADRQVSALGDSGFSGVVLVARGDSQVFERAYGRGSNRPTTATAFWIASMTKGFTAAAILKLQEEHRLSVRDTVGKFFHDAAPDKRGITIHQLLTHTSGLRETGAAYGVSDRAASVKRILAAPLEYQPASGYRYINEDYQLLAAIIEVVSGQTWENFVQSTILEPAALHHTGFWCQRARSAPAPIAGTNGEHSVCQRHARDIRKRASDDWAHRGADGMSSTAEDLWRWLRVIRDGKILSHASDSMLVAPQVRVRREPTADVYYGYGVRVYRVGNRTTEVMYSGSGDDGHTSIARVLPRGLTVIVLSNSGAYGGTTWSSYVAHRIVSAPN